MYNSRHCFGILPKELWKLNKHSSQDSRYPWRDLDLDPRIRSTKTARLTANFDEIYLVQICLKKIEMKQAAGHILRLSL
jgi:hypothetical protein